MKRNKIWTNILEFIIGTLIFISVVLIYNNQKRLSYNNGKGVDGFYYYQAIEQIIDGKTEIIGTPPFVNRLGNHIIVATYAKFYNKDILTSALHINLIGTWLTVILLIIWLRFYVKTFWIRILLMSLYLFTWHVPLRLLFFVPLLTDVWGTVFFIGLLILLKYIKDRFYLSQNITFPVIIFSVIIATSSLFRESNIIIGIGLFFISNPISRNKLSYREFIPPYLGKTLKTLYQDYKQTISILFFLPIILSLIFKEIASSFIVIQNNIGYSYLKAIIQWFYNKSLVEYITAIFIAFGPIITLVPFFFSYFKKFFKDKEELFFILICTFIIGFIAGGDTERILYMSSYPIVFILIGISLEKVCKSSKSWWLIVLGILQLFAARVFWNVPDFPNEFESTPIPFFGLIGDQFQYLYLYSFHGNQYINTIIFLEYIALLVISYFIIGNKIKTEKN